jgi:hypothetical protein
VRRTSDRHHSRNAQTVFWHVVEGRRSHNGSDSAAHLLPTQPKRTLNLCLVSQALSQTAFKSVCRRLGVTSWASQIGKGNRCLKHQTKNVHIKQMLANVSQHLPACNLPPQGGQIALVRSPSFGIHYVMEPCASLPNWMQRETTAHSISISPCGPTNFEINPSRASSHLQDDLESSRGCPGGPLQSPSMPSTPESSCDEDPGQGTDLSFLLEGLSE